MPSIPLPSRFPRARSAWTAAACCLALAAVPSLEAQSLGEQDFAPSHIVQINDFTGGDQTDPAVGLAADGSMIVVWDHGFSIRGRRLDANLDLVGDDFLVSFNTGSVAEPDVCVDADGNFVTVWQQDSFQDNIRLRRNVGGNFSPTNSDDAANSVFDNQARGDAKVACQDAGSFVVAWRGSTTGVTDAIVGRRFVLGVAQDEEFVVNTYTAEPPSQAPGIGMDENGDFVIVWGQDDQSGAMPSAYAGVASRRYMSDGTPLDAFQVLVDAVPSTLYNVGVDRATDGDFAVVWEDQDGLVATVSAELFDPQGNSLASTQFAPSGNFSGDVRGTGVFAGPDGAFLLVTNDPDSEVMEHQRYVDPLVAEGAPWQQGTGPSSRNALDVAGRLDGSFVVVWSEFDPASSSDEIFAQQWIPALFADGFEGGDLLEWSESAQ